MSSAIYEGTVTHVRWKPFVHRLQFGLFSLLIDLDDLERLERIPFFSHNRANVVSFHDEDFGPRDGSDLRRWLSSEMAKAGIDDPPGRIRVLILPRLLGYQFNPLTVWFIDDATGEPGWVLYEIHNTFGEAHSHLVTLDETGGRSEHGFDKELFVSPFFDAEGSYRVRIIQPDARLRIVIDYVVDGSRALTATLVGDRRPLTSRQLAGALVRYPLVTFKVIAGIHWEAAKLWLKGAKYRSRPSPPAATVTAHGRMAA